MVMTRHMLFPPVIKELLFRKTRSCEQSYLISDFKVCLWNAYSNIKYDST